MTQDEAIAAVRAGQRVVMKHSLATFKVQPREPHEHWWRTIACNYEHDVVECGRCGEQRVARCNFDEDMS